jgi:hypothetical protein
LRWQRLTELLKCEAALFGGQPRERFRVCLLDRFGRRGAKHVTVPFDRLLVLR